MTGSQRSCSFMPSLLLFLISLLLLHGGAASSVEATTAASSCSNGTKAGDCVSVANRRVEDEDEAPAGAGGQFMDSVRQLPHLTDKVQKPPPVCHTKIYAGHCYVPANPQSRGCHAYDRCR